MSLALLSLALPETDDLCNTASAVYCKKPRFGGVFAIIRSMNSAVKNSFYFFLVAILLGGSFFFFLKEPASPKYQQQTNEIAITIGNTEVHADVADTDAERIQGLSGRESLEEGRGMLFIFDTEARHGIWMKDMNFPLDIVWLDAGKRVIWVEKNVSPDTYPNAFYPKEPAKYVLELPSGSTERLSFDTGDIMYFDY
jgi:uncharacterized membrane protein (UPF0127 family)